MSKFQNPESTPIVCDGCGSQTYTWYKMSCGHNICHKQKKDGCTSWQEECPTIQKFIHPNKKLQGIVKKCFCGVVSILNPGFSETYDAAMTSGFTEASLIKNLRPKVEMVWLDSFVPCKCVKGVYLTCPSRCINCGICWDDWYEARSVLTKRNWEFNGM